MNMLLAIPNCLQIWTETFVFSLFKALISENLLLMSVQPTLEALRPLRPPVFLLSFKLKLGVGFKKPSSSELDDLTSLLSTFLVTKERKRCKSGILLNGGNTALDVIKTEVMS